MTEITCLHLRRSYFIERHVVFDVVMDNIGRLEVAVKLCRGFEDLGMNLFRNKVEGHFKGSKTFPSKEWNVIRQKVRDFCEKHATGYWTWRTAQTLYDEADDSNIRQLEVMFEKPEDLEFFLKNCGLIMRLTY